MIEMDLVYQLIPTARFKKDLKKVKSNQKDFALVSNEGQKQFEPKSLAQPDRNRWHN